MVLLELIRAPFLTNREDRHAAVDRVLQKILETLCAWLLSTFSLFQDLFLASERCRSLILYAFQRRYDAIVKAALAPPASNPHSFDTLEYHVDPNAKQLLQFAGLHALSVQLTAEKALAPSQLLPCVSRVLLTVEEEKNSARYLEAVACALANSMHAALLPVDSGLLSRLAAATFSGPGLEEESPGGGLPWDGSSGGSSKLGGPRLRMAWEALRCCVHARQEPTVLFLRAADRLLCGSTEAYEGFSEAWGSPEILALEGGASRAPVVMVAACALAERGAGITEGRPKPEGGGGNGGEGEEDGEDSLAPKASKGGLFKGLFGGDEMGLFDDDSGLGTLLKELEGSLLDDSPNPRRVLPRLFPTRIRLLPPSSGPAALRHQQRMARDALEAAEDENYRAARATALSAGVKIPPKASGLYSCSAPLPKADWSKALAWAVALHVLQQEQQRAQQQHQQLLQGRTGTAAGGEALAGLPAPAPAGAGACQGATPAALHSGDGLAGAVAGGQECGGDAASGNDLHEQLQKGSLLKPLLLPSSPSGSRHGGAIDSRCSSSSSAGSVCDGAGAVSSSGTTAGAQRVQQGECNGEARTQNGLPRGSDGTPSVGYEGRESSTCWGTGPAPCRGGSSAGGMGRMVAQGVRMVLLTLVPASLLCWLPALLQAYTPAALQPLAQPVLAALGWLAGAPRQEAQHATQQANRQLSTSASVNLGDVAGGGGAAGGQDISLGGEVLLTPQELMYGLGMLKRSGGGVKQGVRAGNSYEKKLLEEVLSPEECGGGFSEVGALEDAKRALREAVQLPLQHPHLFGGGALARPSKGVLLFGPPGTGKTLLARAAAAECGASFLGINPSSVASKWFGDGVRFIRAAFTLAAKLSPCVIFVDEVDALLGRRNSLKEHEALREMKNEFMAQWDGIKPGQGSRVMVLGATNRPFDIDEAVLRRFTHRVFVGLPARGARQGILEVVLAGEALAPDVDLGRLAEMTDGYSGSDLRQLCVQAAMQPVRELLEAESRASTATSSGAQGQAQRTKHAQQQEAQQPATGAAGPVGASAAGATGRGGGQGAGTDVGWRAGSETALAGGSGPAQAEGDDRDEEESAEAAVAAASLLPSRPAQPLGQLLAMAEGIAGEACCGRNELRPICMLDFEEARKEVTATVDPDSHTIQELNEWNQQFGTIGSRRGVENKRLSYYL